MRSIVRVEQVLPGYWEALCLWCDEPLLAQVSTWERALSHGCEHLAEVHRVLSSADPEPVAGTVVRDAGGMDWVNTGVYPCAWMDVDCKYEDVETWRKIAGNYGPVTVLEWGEGDV